MVGHFSDDDCSVGHEADFVDASADTEGVMTSLGVADESAVDLNQQE